MSNPSGTILFELRNKNNLTQDQVAEAVGISRVAYTRYENGSRVPKTEIAARLSEYFGISIKELLTGAREPEEEDINKEKKYVTVPVLGSIPAGVPFEAIQNIEDYEDLPAAMINPGAQYFGLRVKGDSMEPEYLDGDTIILQRVEECNSGEDCAVMINGDDATFKRVRLQENGLTLQPLNHKYEPRFFTAREVREIPVRIIGVCVEVRRRIRRK